MNFLKNKTNEEKLGIVLFSLGILCMLIVTYIGLTKLSVWYDEIFSITMVNLPLGDMIDLGKRDVHPILYYFIFKGFAKIFEIFGFDNIVLIGKIVSMIPMYLLTILSITKIRKNWGILTSGLFTFCISSMPLLMIYFVEIRMYSWSLFFVTASLVYIYEIIKNPNLKNWAILTILTILSANTHYFSTIASFSLYLLFLLYILYYNRNLLKKWIVSASIAVLSFIPWFLVLLYQLPSVQDGYWIKPLTHETIISYIYFILSPTETGIKSNELMSPTILGTLFLISLIILVIYYLKKEDKKELKISFSLIGIGTFILVPLIGIIISLIDTPIFHIRYMIPILGCLWLGISVLLSKYFNEKKEIFYPILILILVIGLIGTVNFIDIEKKELQYSLDYKNSLENVVGSGNIVFHDGFNLYYKLSTYHIPDNHHLKWEDNFIEHVNEALQDPGIQAEINNGSRVFFSNNDEGNYQKAIDSGLKIKKVYTHHEDYNSKKYEIYEIII